MKLIFEKLFLNLDITEKQFGIFRFIFYGSIFFIYWRLYLPAFVGFNGIFWSPPIFHRILFLDPVNIDLVKNLNYLFLSSLALCAVGFYYRIFSWLAFLSGLITIGFRYCYSYEMHPDIPVLWSLFAQCFVLTGDFSLDNYLRKTNTEQNPKFFSFAIRFHQLNWAVVFFSAGICKLVLDPINWFNGVALQLAINDTFLQLQKWVMFDFQKESIQWLNSHVYFFSVLSTLACLLEIFALAAFFRKKWAQFLIPMVIIFQASIFIFMNIRFIEIIPIYFSWFSIYKRND